MTFLIAVGALALAGFVFYINNKQHEDHRNEVDELRRELRNHKADIQAKVNLNFGGKKK